jgi:hypothetical protein
MSHAAPSDMDEGCALQGGRKAKMYVTYNALKKGGLKALYALKGMT